MGLREQAAADLKGILEDVDSGFGWPITVTDPSGEVVSLTGFSNDISAAIDPETGLLVAGRRASVALALESLRNAGIDTPKGISDGSQRPWVVTFADIEGTAHTFKVAEALPDRAAGIVTCLLESYRP